MVGLERNRYDEQLLGAEALHRSVSAEIVSSANDDRPMPHRATEQSQRESEESHSQHPGRLPVAGPALADRPGRRRLGCAEEGRDANLDIRKRVGKPAGSNELLGDGAQPLSDAARLGLECEQTRVLHRHRRLRREGAYHLEFGLAHLDGRTR